MNIWKHRDLEPKAPRKIWIVKTIFRRPGKNLKLARLHISHHFNMHAIWLQSGRVSPAKFKYANRTFESFEIISDTVCGIKIGEDQIFAGRAESQLALAKYKAKYKNDTVVVNSCSLVD